MVFPLGPGIVMPAGALLLHQQPAVLAPHPVTDDQNQSWAWPPALVRARALQNSQIDHQVAPIVAF